MAVTTPEQLPTPVSMIDRVVRILDAFEGADGLTLAQVVRQTGLPRSTAHRILEHLAEVRYLRREEHTYRLGMRIMELGSLVIHQDRVREAATPYLHRLHQSTGLVAHLAVLDANEVVYLDKVGNRFGTLLPSRVGGRLPAARTGVGKALLAHAPSAAHQPERLRAEPGSVSGAWPTTGRRPSAVSAVWPHPSSARATPARWRRSRCAAPSTNCASHASRRRCARPWRTCGGRRPATRRRPAGWPPPAGSRAGGKIPGRP